MFFQHHFHFQFLIFLNVWETVYLLSVCFEKKASFSFFSIFVSLPYESSILFTSLFFFLKKKKPPRVFHFFLTFIFSDIFSSLFAFILSNFSFYVDLFMVSRFFGPHWKNFLPPLSRHCPRDRQSWSEETHLKLQAASARSLDCVLHQAANSSCTLWASTWPRPFDQKGSFSGFTNSSFTPKLNFWIFTCFCVIWKKWTKKVFFLKKNLKEERTWKNNNKISKNIKMWEKNKRTKRLKKKKKKKREFFSYKKTKNTIQIYLF